jgi:uncharacterized lipoprotein YehR (DUF1307 family)
MQQYLLADVPSLVESERTYRNNRALTVSLMYQGSYIEINIEIRSFVKVDGKAEAKITGRIISAPYEELEKISISADLNNVGAGLMVFTDQPVAV